MEMRAAKDTGYGRSMLTIYQKMKLQKGVVVMNIDAGDYLASLDEICKKTTKPCFIWIKGSAPSFLE